MTTWILAVVCLVASDIVATVLAWRLRKKDPGLYRAVGSPSAAERAPPFWLYHFLNRSKLARLAPRQRAAAVLGVVLLSSGLALVAAGLLRFLRHGSL